MADRITIARPYAKAAFKAAAAAKRLPEWSEGLNVGAATVTDERVAPLLGSPRTTPAQLAQLVIDIAGKNADTPLQNFLRTLAENRRLGYLPEIAQVFDRMKDEAEGTVDVTVTSAAPLSATEQDRLAAALAKRFGRKVRVHAGVDATLIGGAVIRAGDLVIDGSYKSKLERLGVELAV